ncbi:MAG: Ig-like domain-containing protein [Caldilineaceae bacterium]|nr:Ig-like domain-containing protein [Caldilineaceae bacterium]
MLTFIHYNNGNRLHDLDHFNTRLFRTILLALLLAIAVLAFAATPAFAQSEPLPVPNILVDDYISVPKNGSADIEVLGNDTIGEFGSFDFSSPDNGRFRSFTSNATRVTLSFEYVPNVNFVGKDSFSYWVTDRSGQRASARVYISIRSGLECSTCLNRHEATPVNVTIGGDGAFNYHFIGDGGVSTGPVLPPVKKLAGMYKPDSGNIVLFSGTNTISGAPVTISYLSDEKVVHVNTSYQDRQNGSMKPYIFVIGLDHKVSHWEW